MHLAETRRVPELGGEVPPFLDLFFLTSNVLAARRDTHQTKSQYISAIFVNQLEQIGRIA